MTIEYRYYDDAKKNILSKTWKVDGKIRRDDGPSCIHYYMSGKIMGKLWTLDGKKHRLNGPADIGYHESGEVMYKTWYKDGKEYRPGDLPSYIYYDILGIVCTNAWRLGNNKHRLTGPAYIRYYNSGNIIDERWYIFGKRCDEKKVKRLSSAWKGLILSRRIERMNKTSDLIKWYYGPFGLGGRKDRNELREFVTGM